MNKNQLGKGGGECGPQSAELTGGPPFFDKGSSHQRKSAACSKFDMVWLYRSHIPVGGGDNFLVQMISTCV